MLGKCYMVAEIGLGSVVGGGVEVLRGRPSELVLKVVDFGRREGRCGMAVVIGNVY